MAGPFDAPLDSRDTNDISDHLQHNVPNDPMALAAAATRESLTQNYKIPQYEFEGKVARVDGPASPASGKDVKDTAVDAVLPHAQVTYRVWIPARNWLAPNITQTPDTFISPGAEDAINTYTEVTHEPHLSGDVYPPVGSWVKVQFPNPSAPGGMSKPYLKGILSMPDPQVLTPPASAAHSTGPMYTPTAGVYKGKKPKNPAQLAYLNSVDFHNPPVKCDGNLKRLNYSVAQRATIFGFSSTMTAVRVPWFSLTQSGKGIRVSSVAEPAFLLARNALAQDPASMRYLAESVKFRVKKKNPRGTGGLVTRCISHRYKYDLGGCRYVKEVKKSGSKKKGTYKEVFTGRTWYKCGTGVAGKAIKNKVAAGSSVASVAAKLGSSFCFSNLSNHSFGTATDINPVQNPMRKPFTTDMPPTLVAIFKKYGFRSGAEYTGTPDPMHFEFMGDPEEAASLWKKCQEAGEDKYYSQNWESVGVDGVLQKYPPHSSAPSLTNVNAPWSVSNPGQPT